MSGLITLIDGPGGSGKSTFATGLPKPIAVLDTDVDGWRWLKEEAQYYEACRNVDTAKTILDKWAADKSIASIIVDTWAHFWQVLSTQVLDGSSGDKNKFRAWGPAKLTLKRLYPALIKAKQRGAHVLLTAHTKEDLKVDDSGGKTEISKQGQKANVEPDPTMLPALLDLHLRMAMSKMTGKRWIEIAKCRPQRKVNGVWTPLLSGQIPIEPNKSDLAYKGIMQKIGVLPESTSAPGIDNEDAVAQNAMLNASINRQ